MTFDTSKQIQEDHLEKNSTQLTSNNWFHVWRPLGAQRNSPGPLAVLSPLSPEAARSSITSFVLSFTYFPLSPPFLPGPKLPSLLFLYKVEQPCESKNQTMIPFKRTQTTMLTAGVEFAGFRCCSFGVDFAVELPYRRTDGNLFRHDGR
jgi:hypothetical protein